MNIIMGSLKSKLKNIVYIPIEENTTHANKFNHVFILSSSLITFEVTLTITPSRKCLARPSNALQGTPSNDS